MPKTQSTFKGFVFKLWILPIFAWFVTCIIMDWLFPLTWGQIGVKFLTGCGIITVMCVMFRRELKKGLK